MITNTEEFIKKANQIHDGKYNYSKVIYKYSAEKVCIICPIHGEFWQTPNSHLNGNGCPACKNEKTGYRCRSTTEIFINKSRLIHGNLYGYDKVNYKNCKSKVIIICPTHGEFEQIPSNHLKGCGCPLCKGNRISKTKTRSLEDFIEKAIKVHGFKYDYSKSIYVNSITPIEIICKEHNMSFWQDPGNHLQGKGCPYCNESHLEKEVRNCLLNNNILFEEQKSWDWLVFNSKQKVDFFLPRYNTVIECQGIQHFEEVKFFGGEEKLKLTRLRDKNKLDLCKEHGIDVLYYSNLGKDYQYFSKVIEGVDNLINELKIRMTN